MNNLKSVFDYYENCWDERFRNGHNNISCACHYGFYIDPSINSLENTRNDYDLSKKKLNDILIEKINVNKNSKIKILDAGCGYGGTTLIAARKYISEDVSEYMQVVRNNLAEFRNPYNESLYIDTNDFWVEWISPPQGERFIQT